MKYLWSVLLLSTLVGCASLPSQNYSFSLSANDKKNNQWSLSGIAKKGAIYLKVPLPGSYDQSDRIKLNIGFGYREYGISNMILRISDLGCAGSFEVALDNQSGPKQFSSSVFKSRIRWDDSLELIVKWDESNWATVVVNGESKKIPLARSPGELKIIVLQGTLKEAELHYENTTKIEKQ